MHARRTGPWPADAAANNSAHGVKVTLLRKVVAGMVEVKHPGTIDAAELPSDVVDSIRFLAQAFPDNPLKQDPQRLLLRGRP